MTTIPAPAITLKPRMDGSIDIRRGKLTAGHIELVQGAIRIRLEPGEGGRLTHTGEPFPAVTIELERLQP